MGLDYIEKFSRYDEVKQKMIYSDIDVAHNEYLNIQFHQGVFALLAYLTAFVAAAVHFFRNGKKSRVVAACGAAFLCYAFEAFFGISVLIMAPAMWICLGLMEGAVARMRERPELLTAEENEEMEWVEDAEDFEDAAAEEDAEAEDENSSAAAELEESQTYAHIGHNDNEEDAPAAEASVAPESDPEETLPDFVAVDANIGHNDNEEDAPVAETSVAPESDPEETSSDSVVADAHIGHTDNETADTPIDPASPADVESE